MKNQSQTLTEQAAKNSRQRFYFGMLLAFMATTSFTFGMTYLDRFYSAMLGNFQVIPVGVRPLLFQLLGGISALLLTTYSYTQWKTIRRNDTTTGAQYNIALIGELTAFISDIAYSAFSLATLVMSNRMTDDLMGRLEWISVGLFISVCMIHAVLRHLYEEYDSSVMEARIAAQMAGNTTSERLLWTQKVQSKALTLASNNMQGNIDDIALLSQNAFMAQLVAQIPNGAAMLESVQASKMENEKRPTVDDTVIIYPQQEPMGKA